MRSLVWRGDGQVRAPLQLAAFLVLSVAGFTLAAGLLGGPLQLLLGGVRISLGPWFALAGLIAAHAVALRLFQTPGGWGAVGLDAGAWRVRPLLVATLAGALALGGPVTGLWAAGRVAFIAQPPGDLWGEGARLLLLLVPSALVEELALRGFPLTVLTGAIGRLGALATTSAAFALAHLLNPSPTVQTTLVVAVAGVFLGTVRLATGSLAAAWLAHLAVNVVQALVLHAPVSGLDFPTPDWRLADRGPAWLTGGAWGPEAGAAAALGMVGVTFLYARRGLGARRDAKT